MAANNQPLEVALRANTLLTDAPTLARALPIASHLDPAIAEAVVPDEPFDAHNSPLFQQGHFHAQSRAAMLVAHALAPLPGQRVLDLCAAPGGKTTHLAALMQGQGEIHAIERHPGRAAALERTARRLHAANVRVHVGDAQRWHEAIGQPAPGSFAPSGSAPSGSARGSFDRVLVDPPCSGLGTLQARADLRWRVTPQSIDQLASTQATILAAGAAALCPGGVLVYSTCTISPLENERLIASFLDSHPDFTLDGPGSLGPGGLGPGGLGPHGLAGAGPTLTLPHRDHTAGFFIARLRRSGG
jgi:16S rRNA (cytosine967-C5)-methyltransferase